MQSAFRGDFFGKTAERREKLIYRRITSLSRELLLFLIQIQFHEFTVRYKP